MPPLLQSLVSLSAVIGPVATLIGFIQSRGWLAAIGAMLVCIAMAATLYARTQRLRIDGASIEIEGISLDALNIANLRRRVSRDFMIQNVHHLVTIDGADLTIVWRYAGYCRVKAAAAFEFSIDCENSIPFRELHCFGFDLKNDSERRNRIPPFLIGPDSISKKIAIPFAHPLQIQQPFDIELHCRLPATYRRGTGYYMSSLSFDQLVVDRCTVQLVFRGEPPEWVRVYACQAGQPPQIRRSLSPLPRDGDEHAVEYVDTAENRSARSTMVYLFRRRH